VNAQSRCSQIHSREDSTIRLSFSIIAVFACLVVGAPSLAQTDADSIAATETIEDVVAAQGDSTAMVEVLGKDLFSLTASSVVGASERAEKLSGKILEAAKEMRLSPDELYLLRDDRIQATLIMCDNFLIGAVWDYEAEVAGMKAEDLAGERMERIRQAIVDYRTDFSAKSLIRGGIYSAAALAGLLIVLFIIARLRRRLEGSLDQRLSGRTWFKVLTGDGLVSFAIAVNRVVHLIVGAWLILGTLNFILSLFPWTYGIASQVFEMAVGPMKTFGAAFVREIPSMFFLAFVVIATVFILRGVRFFFTEIERKRIRIHGFYADWAVPTYNIVRVIVIAFALVFAFPYIPGSNSSAFKGMSIFVGVLVSLGSGGAMANMVSGIILIYMRPYVVGDRVQIGDTVGDVVHRNLLTTRLRTPKNERVTIPNTSILSGEIINFTSKKRTKELILHTSVTIGYDAPWETVHKLLLDAAAATEHVLKDPAPFVLQLGLHDFYVEYELNASTDEPREIPATYSALHQNIQDQFNQAGVEILSPHYRTLRKDEEASS